MARATVWARNKCKEYQIPSLLEQVAVALHRWVGTYISIERPISAIMSRIYTWRNYRWWKALQCVNSHLPRKDHIRHPSPGYLYRFEDQLLKFAGEDWDSTCRNPKNWNIAKRIFVQKAVQSWMGQQYLRLYEFKEQIGASITVRKLQEIQEMEKIAGEAEINSSDLVLDEGLNQGEALHMRVGLSRPQLPTRLITGDNAARW